jgi:hypothetical protein
VRIQPHHDEETTVEDARIQELEARVAQLTGLVERLTATTETSAVAIVAADAAGADIEQATSSRRKMLRNVALVAGGAVAVTVAGGALPAAANANDPLITGQQGTTTGPNTSTLKTSVNFVPPGTTTAGNGFLFQAGSAFATDDSAHPAAVAAWSELPNYPTGLYAFTSSTGAGAAVAAIGAGATSYGVDVFGLRAHLLLEPNGLAGPARTDAHQVGELIEDSTGDLWLCILAGTPGTWRKLAGAATAGALHPISPVRVYDSRSPQPTQSTLATGANRVVSVASGRDPVTGAIIPAQLNIVPAGATAVVGNITVTDTEGALGGFLAITPGNATVLAGSSVNWFGPGQNIANSFTAKLDANRQLKIFGGGAPSPATNFIIDINGFYL